MTEKDYNPNQKQKKAIKKAAVATKEKDRSKKVTKKDVKKDADKESNDKKTNKQTKSKKKEKSKKKVTKKKVKKSKAVVNSHSLPISTKKSVGVCKFIKGKKISEAIQDLEQVSKGKKAVPLKGEIPHRKGKIMSGRFPKKAAGEFITVLKGLAGNSIVNGIEDPIIVEAIANMASRPYGRFGATQKKRTHLKIVAKDKKMLNKNKNQGGKK